jgi:hypothetical protein
MKIITTAMVAILFFVACGKDAKEKSVKEFELQKLELADVRNNIADTTVQPLTPKQKNDGNEPLKTVSNPDWDKKIIKTADLNLEVKDYEAYYSFLKENTRNIGGYIAKEEQKESDYKIENTLEIKVPVDQFDNAVTLFSGKAEKIYERRISSQDVTTEYVDTKSRMEAKRQVRQRYMDLLKQAKNMEEVLNVQSEINSIQEEIESAAGRIEYLGHSSSYSTINLTFYKVVNASAKDNDTPTIGTKLSDAFKSGWSWITDLFVGLVSIWPLFILIAVLVILYKRLRTTKPGQA